MMPKQTMSWQSTEMPLATDTPACPLVLEQIRERSASLSAILESQTEMRQSTTDPVAKMDLCPIPSSSSVNKLIKRLDGMLRRSRSSEGLQSKELLTMSHFVDAALYPMPAPSESISQTSPSSPALQAILEKFISGKPENVEFKDLKQEGQFYEVEYPVLPEAPLDCQPEVKAEHSILDQPESVSTLANTLTDQKQGQRQEQKQDPKNQESSFSLVDLKDQLAKNYKACQWHDKTTVQMPIEEVSNIVSKYSDEFKYSENSKSELLLVPLNATSTEERIKANGRLRIGRNSSWLLTKALVVSRHHCEIYNQEGQFYLCDVGSSSGSFINGRRVSEEGERSKPILLANGDLIQIGVQVTEDTDEETPLEHLCVQTLVLLAFAKKTSMIGSLIEPIARHLPIRKAINKNPFLITKENILKASKRAARFPLRLAEANIRMYIELGDLLHSDGFGMSVISAGGLAYHAIFNNYKMHWEVAIMGKDGSISLDVLPNSTSIYSIVRDNRDLGRISSITPQKIIVETINPMGAFNLTGNLRKGVAFILQHEQDNRQTIIGEALMTTQRTRWGRKTHLLEARLPLFANEQILLLAILFSGLRQIESN
jgi:hypothetical protein